MSSETVRRCCIRAGSDSSLKLCNNQKQKINPALNEWKYPLPAQSCRVVSGLRTTVSHYRKSFNNLLMGSFCRHVSFWKDRCLQLIFNIWPLYPVMFVFSRHRVMNVNISWTVNWSVTGNRSKKVKWCHRCDLYFKIKDFHHSVTPVTWLERTITVIIYLFRIFWRHFYHIFISYVKGWVSNSVLLRAPTELCRYFWVPFHIKSIDVKLSSQGETLPKTK